jgi:hypothetical protein
MRLRLAGWHAQGRLCARVQAACTPDSPWRRAQGLADPHAKVRWAACQALGQLCTDLGPGLQEAEHARILPALMAVMRDFSQPRVQAHAAAALVNFAENCEPVWPRARFPCLCAGEHHGLDT